MPVTRRIRKVANPPRRARARRRPMSAKQIKYFGSPAQKAALKRKRRTRPSSRSRKNPALALTLGAFNPKRSTQKMARRKTAKRRRTRRNARPVARRRVTRRRTATARNNPVRRRRRVTRRRVKRNPTLFGLNIGGSQMATVVIGGLIGVAATKFIPNAIPISLGGGNIVRVLISGLSAFVAAMAANKAVGKAFGDAVLFGGLMQTGSVALNAFLPVIGGQLALTGVGELVNTGGFVVPQNPVLPASVPVQARVGASGLDRAYGKAF